MNNNVDSEVLQELLEIIDEKNAEIRWMRRKVQNLEKREEDYFREEGNYDILRKSKIGKKFIMPFLEKNKKYRDEDGLNQNDIKIIARSKFFDAKWYLKKYPDLKGIDMPLAEHYLRLGWKENRNPSEYFVTKEYLNLNSGVRYRNICPLLHFEKAGKYEGKQYRLNPENERADFRPSEKEIKKWKDNKDKTNKRLRERYNRRQVKPDKIIFCTFQHKYTCNTKYICEELLKRNTNLDIVWLYDPSFRDYYEYPRKVRLIPFDSIKAKKELASARIIVDNGVISFSEIIAKKPEQTVICTWHGSLGFKKMGADIEILEEKDDAVDKFSYNHDILISNSTFEEEVYRTSHWPTAQIWKLGHARNDVLINKDEERIRKMKIRFCVENGISFDKKFVLYAPTFRDDMLCKANNLLPDSVKKKGVYDLDVERLKEALHNKFGGDWVVLMRHHFVNMSNKALKKLIPKGVVDVTSYTDIQELMLMSDVGVTDYSSWILDYILTRKPGFLFTVDEDEFERDRGMYYPLSESPLSVSGDIDELMKNIESFDQGEYENRIDEFLKEKGCIDDGHASERIVDKILELFDK